MLGRTPGNVVRVVALDRDPVTAEFRHEPCRLPLTGLEESRIALWSARMVYSFYNVGPLDDVRFEFAANLDDFEPIDLGACGEPYTINFVCGIPTELWAHGLLGIGIIKGLHIVNHKMLKRVIIWWIISPFISAAVSIALYYMFIIRNGG